VNGGRTYVNATGDLARPADAYGGPVLAVLNPDRIAVSTLEAAGHGWVAGSRITVQLARGDATTCTVAATYDEKVSAAGRWAPTPMVAAPVGVLAAVLPAIRAARLNVPAATAHD
jgi:hypothetical protein